jgi:hypothetical protein
MLDPRMIFERSTPSARIFAFIAESMCSACCAAAGTDNTAKRRNADAAIGSTLCL